MAYVVTPEPAPTLPVLGTADCFPVNRIFCVGRNYADHAREMGHNPDREPPFFFLKPGHALLPEGRDFPYPSSSHNVHYEFELVAALDKGGTDIRVEDALNHIYGYAVGLDMTRRDLQLQAQKMARPWDVGKAFDLSAPCSAVAPASKIGHPKKGPIWLERNGKRVQSSDLSALIWNVPEIIAQLSSLFRLTPGDLVFTGTPAGVGPVQRGDILHGFIEGVGELTVRVV
ncbi:MAG: fumarylacetoacetate hydrolase [Acidobacteria bacterium]|nr:MAG: fumarylacetoacetate hydrolase [Acidobacteriota bacterium]